MPTSPPRALRVAFYVIAAAFLVHSINGLIVERFVLDIRSFTDYAEVDKLGEAIGSWPWRISGLGHLATCFAMVVVAVGVRRWMVARASSLADYAHGFALLSALGFAANGVASGLGAHVVDLLEERNQELAGTAIVAYSVLVPVVNGVAIVCLGVVILLLARFLGQQHLAGRGFVRYSWVTGASALVMAVAYVPAYLFLVLVWMLWGASVVRAHLSVLGR
jgi:hypothetical protein